MDGQMLMTSLNFRSNVIDMVSFHFRAPDMYSHWKKLNASENLICWLTNPVRTVRHLAGHGCRTIIVGSWRISAVRLHVPPWVCFTTHSKCAYQQLISLLCHRPYNQQDDLNSPDYGRDWTWVFCAAFSATDPARFDQASMVDRLRRSANLPNIAVESLSISHWFVHESGGFGHYS